MVHRVRILPLSTPRVDSAMPPASAEPMPELLLARCIRIARTKNKQRKTSPIVNKPIKKFAIMDCI